jgi:hypothetical protein
LGIRWPAHEVTKNQIEAENFSSGWGSIMNGISGLV